MKDSLINMSHPEWSYNANIYEVNIRQYTSEGTFKAFQEHLPRLKSLGVDILWLMPIHPIGEKNRKGTLGSYYSIKDYLDVNPEFGTLADFKDLVDTIHGMGMKVIIDWVANHSAWDNPLTESNPEWYTKDDNGNFIPPVPDWADVIDFDFSNLFLRKYMADAMSYWVRETDIDGYRCDVAGMVPLEFWEQVRRELDTIKPVFLLAEWDEPGLHNSAFDMTYDWGLNHLFNDIAQGIKTANDIENHLLSDSSKFPKDAFRMYFTTNHDENSWNGTVFERLGDGAKTFAVLTATMNGMPLIYSGQEVGLNKRLEFFEKDLIDWQDHELTEFYTKLLYLKKTNPVLRNGERSGVVSRVHTMDDKAIFAFVNKLAAEKLFVITNLSSKSLTLTFEGSEFEGTYAELFTDESITFTNDSELILGAWDYRVFISSQ